MYHLFVCKNIDSTGFSISAIIPYCYKANYLVSSINRKHAIENYLISFQSCSINISILKPRQQKKKAETPNYQILF